MNRPPPPPVKPAAKSPHFNAQSERDRKPIPDLTIVGDPNARKLKPARTIVRYAYISERIPSLRSQPRLSRVAVCPCAARSTTAIGGGLMIDAAEKFLHNIISGIVFRRNELNC